jgi:hypothetical protein
VQVKRLKQKRGGESAGVKLPQSGTDRPTERLEYSSHAR